MADGFVFDGNGGVPDGIESFVAFAATDAIKREIVEKTARAMGVPVESIAGEFEKIDLKTENGTITTVPTLVENGSVFSERVRSAFIGLIGSGAITNTEVGNLDGSTALGRTAWQDGVAKWLGGFGSDSTLTQPSDLFLDPGADILPKELKELRDLIASLFFGTNPRFIEQLFAETENSLAALARLGRARLNTKLVATTENAEPDVIEFGARLEHAFPASSLIGLLSEPTSQELERYEAGNDVEAFERVKQEYPGLFVGRWRAGDVFGTMEKLRESVKTNEGLNYLTTDLDALEGIWAGATDEQIEAMKEFWCRYQILYRVAGTAEAAVAFAKKGVRSARDVAEDRAVPEDVRRRARLVVGEITNAVLSIIQINDLPPSANNQSGTLKENLGSFTALFPSNKTTCRCEHCRSVFSPAAYLSDLARFTDKVEEKAGISRSLYRLVKRRPKLMEEEIGCSSTNDEVWYLDLVNEVLKNTLGVRAPGLRALTTAATRNDRFEWPLSPIDASIAGYLAMRGQRKTAVVRAGLHDHAEFADRLAEARLGLSRPAAQAITKPLSQSALRKLYHTATLTRISNKPQLKALPLPELLGSFALDRAELESLLRTPYVVGTTDVMIKARRKFTDSYQNDSENVVGSTWDVLRRLAKMIRLREVVGVGIDGGWTAAELGYVLKEFGTSELQSLTKVHLLRGRLGLSVAEVCAFEKELSRTPLRSVSTSTLASRVYGSPDGSVFEKRTSFADSQTRIAAALDLTAEELRELVARLPNNVVSASAAAKLTKRSLTVLYRYPTLASALGISVHEVLDLCETAGVSCIKTLDDVLAVVEFSDWLKDSSLTAGVAKLAVSGGEVTAWPFGGRVPADDGEAKALFEEVLAAAWSVSEESVAAARAFYGDPAWTDGVLRLHLNNPNAARKRQLLSYAARLQALLHAIPAGLLEHADGQRPLLAELAMAGAPEPRTINVELLHALTVLSKTLPRWRRASATNDFGAALRVFAAAIPGSLADRKTSLAHLTGESQQVLKGLLDGWPALNGDPVLALRDMSLRIALSGAFALSGADLIALTRLADPPDPNDPQAADWVAESKRLAAALRAGIDSGPSASQFAKALEKLDGAEREATRDLYIGLLSDKALPGLTPDAKRVQPVGAEQWYEYLLIDTVRGGCAKTTRVATLISSVQLYLNRINDGTEKSASAFFGSASDDEKKRADSDAIHDHEWSFRHFYRLWEASIRLYLYPEDSLDPTVRDDRTEAFNVLMDAVRKNPGDIKSHIHEYLREFVTLSSLVPTGAYSTGFGEDGQMIVTSASADEPPQHYLQSYWPEKNRWSPIEKIAASIPVRAVSPVLHRGQLRLFWLTKSTRANTALVDGTSKLISYEHKVGHHYVTRGFDGAWGQNQKLDIDFNTLGCGQVNLVSDKFKRIQAIAEAPEPNPPITVKVQELRGAPGATIIVSYKIGSTGKTARIPFDEDTQEAILRLSGFDKDDEDVEAALLLIALVNSIFPSFMQTSTPPIRIDGQGRATISPTILSGGVVFAASDGVRRIAVTKLELEVASPVAFALLPNVVQTKITNALGLVDVSDEPVPIFDSRPHHEQQESYTLSPFVWARPYPLVDANRIRFVVPGRIQASRFQVFDTNFITRRLIRRGYANGSNGAPWLRLGEDRALRAFSQPNLYYLNGMDAYATRSVFADHRATNWASAVLAAHDENVPSNNFGSGAPVLQFKTVVGASLGPVEIGHVSVNGELGDEIVSHEGTSFVVRRMPPDAELTYGEADENLSSHYEVLRLGTSLAEDIVETFGRSLEEGFSMESQLQLAEMARHFDFGPSVGSDRTSVGDVDFNGAMGVYLQEIYFHIPYAIGVHFSNEGKYEEAHTWFKYLFDPAAADNGEGDKERVWRSRYLRGAKRKGLRDLFSKDGSAAERLERDPLNPFALARLRPGALQRAVVLRVVQNLIDWADTHFRRFTGEALVEALRLYVQARAILGERPYEIGSCGETGATSLEEMRDHADRKTEKYLIELECKLATKVRRRRLDSAKSRQQHFLGLRNRRILDYTKTGLNNRQELYSSPRPARAVTMGELTVYAGLRPEKEMRSYLPVAVSFSLPPTFLKPRVRSWRGVAPKTYGTTRLQAGGLSRPGAGRVSSGLLEQLSLIVGDGPIFCVPANPTVAALWDSIDDRLYNLRNCRTLDGEVRALAAFAPQLSLNDLVRQFGRGTSTTLTEMQVAQPAPQYRFRYLLGRANAVADRAASLASAFLAAKERADGEEMAMLRATHESTLLAMNRSTRALELTSAESALEGLNHRKSLVEYRLAYNEELLGTGLIPAEIIQVVAGETARGLRLAAGAVELAASIFHLVPELGSPFSLKYGGKQVGDATSAWGGALRLTAQNNEAMAASATREAGWARRRQGWENQIETAELELKELSTQIRAAEIRVHLANDAIVMHQQQLQHNEEIQNHLANKYGNADLYDWSAGQLSSLHRDAFESARTLGHLAEMAYLNDLGESFTGSTSVAWNAMYDGLHSAHRLRSTFQTMEDEYDEKRKRQAEIAQSFSLLEFAPADLLKLRRDAECTFSISREMLDLRYPGQYHRIIRDVRITVAAVTGPHTSVPIELKLTNGSFATSSGGVLRSGRQSGVMTASSGLNDNGRVVDSFGPEYFNQFEGAGAISQWQLRLPTGVRTFDYDTISDVVLQLVYTAKGPSTAERNTAENLVLNWTQSNGVHKRLVSLRAEHPALLAELRNNTTATLELSANMFPFYSRSSGQIPRMDGVDVKQPTPAGTVTAVLTGTQVVLSTTGLANGDDVVLLVAYGRR